VAINMKKLLFLLAIVIVTITANSQTATFSTGNATEIEKNTNYTITNTTAIWFQFNAEKHYPSSIDYQVNLDSVSGNHTNIAISLYGRKFDDDTWVQIGSTVNSTDGTATETISNTNQNRYRQFKVLFTPTGTGVTTIDFQRFKLWLE